MRVRLDDHEYVVRIPAKAWPYLQVLAQGLSGTAQTIDEARTDEAERKVLAYCVTPQPCEDHAEAVMMQIMLRYVTLVRDIADKFRP